MCIYAYIYLLQNMSYIYVYVHIYFICIIENIYIYTNICVGDIYWGGIDIHIYRHTFSTYMSPTIYILYILYMYVQCICTYILHTDVYTDVQRKRFKKLAHVIIKAKKAKNL